MKTQVYLKIAGDDTFLAPERALKRKTLRNILKAAIHTRSILTREKLCLTRISILYL